MSRQVLIVEDDFDTREAIHALLTREGYEPIVARNGEEALAYLRAHPAPGLIFLDLSMPQMDGWDFLEARREISSASHIPVVVLTATKVNHAHSDMDEIIYKPMDCNALLKAIQKHLRH